MFETWRGCPQSKVNDTVLHAWTVTSFRLVREGENLTQLPGRCQLTAQHDVRLGITKRRLRVDFDMGVHESYTGMSR